MGGGRQETGWFCEGRREQDKKGEGPDKLGKIGPSSRLCILQYGNMEHCREWTPH